MANAGSTPTRAPAVVNPEHPALRGPGLDITSGPIRRTLLVLAIPVLAEQLLNTFVGLVDTYLAGRISPTATAAVGVAAYVSWLVSMLVMLVATGTTALVSRCEGAGDHAEANHFCNQSLTLAAIVGAGLGAMIYAAAPSLAASFNMSGEAYDITVTYLRIEAIGHMPMSVTLVASAAFRGIGKMRVPMLVFVVINMVNVVASCSLVYGLGPVPAMGVNGIVGGTLVARVLGTGIILSVLILGRAGLTLRRRELPITLARTRRIVRIGLPAAVDGGVMWSGQFVFLLIIARLAPNPLGEAYLAAHIVAVRVEAFTYLPAVAWGAATATMIGQALGAGDTRRAVRAGHEGVLQCGLLSIGIAACFAFGASFIYRQMSADPLVQSVGPGPFRILAALQPLLVVSIVYVAGLRGAGDTRFPLLITVIGAFLIRVPLGYFCGIVLQGGLLGAWLGMFGDMTWRAIGAAARFLSGRWVHTRI
jgi:putative MATE family efflux protein